MTSEEARRIIALYNKVYAENTISWFNVDGRIIPLTSLTDSDALIIAELFQRDDIAESVHLISQKSVTIH